MTKHLFTFLIVFLFTSPIFSEDCSNFNGEYGCMSGTQTQYPSDWANRKFQTPPRNDPKWQESYQDLHLLTGYVQIKYNQSKTEAYLTFLTKVNESKLPSDYKLYYYFNSQTAQELNTMTVKSQQYKAFKSSNYEVKAEIRQGDNVIASLILDPLDFIFNHPKINLPSNYENGQKGAIIELFGWPYDDIAKECEFIGKSGYLGIKVFPPNESMLSTSTLENGELNPWFFLYQPVSYRFSSRQGTYDQLKNMINTCRSNNVRVYADAVVNHMTGGGNDSFPDHRNGQGSYCNHWAGKKSSAGSPFYTHDFQFQNAEFSGVRPGLEFPSVPYDVMDFHCERSLSSWTDPFILNYGWLVGLTDLNTESDYVRQRIADYFTSLLSVGFSGFRIDAAKHISPVNLSAIFKKLKDNLGGGDLPDDFITYLEVIIGGEKDLLMCSDNDYCFGKSFENLMSKAGLSASDIDKVKIWESDYPKEFPICGYWPIKSERYVAGLDCHDGQFPGSSSRDMGDKGSVLVKEKNVDKHRNFERDLFTRTDGNWKIKVILSSYTFVESKNAYSFPDGWSDCKICEGKDCDKCTKSVPKVNAYDPNSCGYSVYGKDGNWLEGTYTRVHRDVDIINAMRKWMGIGSIDGKSLGLPLECEDAKKGLLFLK